MRPLILAGLALAATLTVYGQQQPALVDQGGTVAALVDRVVSVTWQL